MLVVNRFRVAEAEADQFRRQIEDAHALLAARDGYLDGSIGRNLDEPDLWVLVTRWTQVGAYRRALSSYEVKVGAVALLGRAIDEPGAYEAVEPGATLNVDRTRSIG